MNLKLREAEVETQNVGYREKYQAARSGLAPRPVGVHRRPSNRRTVEEFRRTVDRRTVELFFRATIFAL